MVSAKAPDIKGRLNLFWLPHNRSLPVVKFLIGMTAREPKMGSGLPSVK